MAYTELAEGGAMAPDVAYGRAADAAATALRLDPELGAAHCTMGYLKTVREFDWAGAEREFKRALELNPSGADAYDLYGRLCAGLERYDDAIALLRRAQELDPLAHRVDIVTALLRAGDYDEAVVRAEEAWSSTRCEDRAQATLGWAYFLSGRKTRGWPNWSGRSRSPRGTRCGWASSARPMRWPATREGARDAAGARERAGHAYVSPYHFAYVYTGLGDADRAMDWLERAVAERAGPAYGIKGSFLFTSLHAHPRFRALLRQMNLA